MIRASVGGVPEKQSIRSMGDTNLMLWSADLLRIPKLSPIQAEQEFRGSRILRLGFGQQNRDRFADVLICSTSLIAPTVAGNC